MQLRGFDSYPIALGDEMRGERASLGKVLEDVERDLRINRRLIVAIENCDLEGFPNRSVIAGYVRSYARYLGMDPEDAYQRFCSESGYRSPAAIIAEQGAGGRSRLPLLPVGTVSAEISDSRFAMPAGRSRAMPAISFGALTSITALLALMAGLGYGGYALLQDIQRVGLAPVNQAPIVVAQAPDITVPEPESGILPLPEPGDYQDGGIMAAMAAPMLLQPIDTLRRDGPISAIDPRTAGVFALPDEEQPVEAQIATRIDSADDAIRFAALFGAGVDNSAKPAEVAMAGQGIKSPDMLAAELVGMAAIGMDAGRMDSGEHEIEVASGAGVVMLHASEDAWVRVRERDNVIFEGTLGAGERYELPPRVDSPVLKAGNAGGLFIVVDGVFYGPLGGRGQIARDVSLVAEDIRGSMPQAEAFGIGESAPVATHQRAETAAAQP